MTDETESTQVKLQSAYDMIHRDATAHIASMKARQWTITHYALLMFVALFYFTTKQVVAYDGGRFLVILAVIGVFAIWLYIIYSIADSMKQKRQRLNRLYKRFPQPAMGVYGEISCGRENLTYDIEIIIFQGAVVFAGGAIVIYNAITGIFSSAPS